MIDTYIRLPSYGRIKTGGLGEERTSKDGNKYRRPVSWDHFKITKNERGEDGNFIIDWHMTSRMAVDGQNPREPKRIGPVTFPVDTIEGNFYTSYAWYTQSGLKCMGNGKTCERTNDDGSRETMECDPMNCPFRDEGKCKPMGVLSVIPLCMDEMGGVYLYRTHSMNTIKTITTQMRMYEAASIEALNRTKFAGVPYYLTAQPTMVTTRKGNKRKIIIVSIDFIEGNMDVYQDYLRSHFSPRLALPEGMPVDTAILNKMMDDPEDFYPEDEEEDEEEASQTAPQAPRKHPVSTPQADSKAESDVEKQKSVIEDMAGRAELIVDFWQWYDMTVKKFSKSGTNTALKKMGIDPANGLNDVSTEKILEATDNMKASVVNNSPSEDPEGRDNIEMALEKKLWTYAEKKSPDSTEVHKKRLIMDDILVPTLGVKRAVIGPFPDCLENMTLQKLNEINESLEKINIEN